MVEEATHRASSVNFLHRAPEGRRRALSGVLLVEATRANQGPS
jgi:hypothetical protein